MVAEMSYYTVTAERGESSKRWVLQAVEAPGALSEVSRLSQAEEYMRDAIHIVTGEPENEISITLMPVLDPATQIHLEKANHLRDEAKAANSQAATEWRKAAALLRETGLTVRDIGAVLGVSHQRAQQLVSA
jgi:hypothetical protein